MSTRVRMGLVAVISALTWLSACSSSRVVQVPPRMDLRSYGTVGMIEFRSTERNELGAQASREFLTALQAAQPGVAVLELGAEEHVLGAMNADAIDPQTVRSIGETYHVDVVIFGVLDAKAVRPKVSLGSAIESLSASAEIEGQLDTRIFEARSGATLWSSVAADRQTVARLKVSEGGLSGIGASHPDEANGRLVTALVQRATRDFRPSYVRERE